MLLKAALLAIAIANSFARPTAAQIVPDNALGENSSSVISESDTRDLIEGGLIRDTSLFHSFRTFNIDTDSGAYFTVPNAVEAIFTRITGNKASNLLGTLGVLGNADLFFLNPNGIVFGPEANLDISGSFTASTAESFAWADGNYFSAINPEIPPLLAFSTTPGLQFGQTASPITQAGDLTAGQDITMAAGELIMSGQISAGEALTLSALGTINVQGSVTGNIITVRANDLFVTDGGLLEISTASDGLSGNLTILADDLVVFRGENEQTGEISGAYNRVDPDTTEDAGNISISANRLELLNGALISASTRGDGNAGQVTLRASDSVLISGEDSVGFGSGVFSQVGSAGKGNAGGILVDTGTLIIEEGGELTVNTLGQGDAGLLEIIASDSVSIDGISRRGLESGAFSRVGSSRARGDAGGVEIETGSLSVTNGASISSNTFGIGNAGSVTIVAREAVFVGGRVPLGQFFLGASIDSQVGNTGVGNGGQVSVTARTVALNDGFIDSDTFGQGNAGRINVVADSLEITDGGRISAATIGDFDAGDVILTVRDNITVVGENSGILSEATTSSTGDAGNIFIDPQIVLLREGARIAVSSRGSGRGGNIELSSGQLILDDNASIFATTASNRGGNITLSIDDLLLLRRGSNLSASAGTAEAGGDGGNISIEADFLVASQNEDNNITANAFLGQGGNISITATGVYGIELRSEDLSTSNDIAASSTFGLDGVVELESPDIDPTEGTTELSDNTEIPSISQRCNPVTAVSSFVATGRGGIPLGPEDAIAAQALWEELYISERTESTHDLSTRASVSSADTTQPDVAETTTLMEAQGWRKGADGRVQLVTRDAPANSLLAAVNTQPSCSLSGK